MLSITQSGKRTVGDATPVDISLTEFRAYDSNRRLCKVSRSDVGTTVHGYNDIGEMTSKSEGVIGGTNLDCLYTPDASKQVTFVNDNLGDIWTVDYPDSSPDVTYTRDNEGNIKTISAGTVSHSYNYNSLNLLDNETLTIGSKRVATNATAKSIVYGYDSSGSLSSTMYPDGDVINFAPNGFGQPTQAIRNERFAGELLEDRTYASGATYYPSGSIDGFTYGNDLIHKTSLNTRLLPKSIKDSLNANVALNYAYIYDLNSNVESITDHVNSAYNLTSMIYDGLDRLTNVTGNEAKGDSAIQYDGLGNITHYQSINRDYEYAYDVNNRLDEVNIPGSSPIPIRGMAYDDRGNITDNSMLSFKYNRANQMVSAKNDTYSYLYDGHNRRVKQTDSKGISYSLYSQGGTLLYRETDEGGINYIYLGKKLIAKDGFIPENGGNQHYRPYGESIKDENSPGAIDDLGYTGHKFDTDLGLSYMQARYYDPVIGRFYSNDPVGFRDIHSFNRYAYANNNPYRYIDPDGKESWAITGSYNVMPARKKLTGGQPQKGDLTRTIGVVGGGAAAVGCAMTPCGIVALGLVGLTLVDSMTGESTVAEAIKTTETVDDSTAEAFGAVVDLVAGNKGKIDGIVDAAKSLAKDSGGMLGTKVTKATVEAAATESQTNEKIEKVKQGFE